MLFVDLSGILRHREGKTGFAHPGTTGYDHQIGGLQTGQQAVQIDEAGGHAVDIIGAGGQLADVIVKFAEHLIDGSQITGHALLADAENGLFGIVHDRFQAGFFIVSQLGDQVGGFQHAAAHGGFFDNAPIGHRMQGRWHVAHQRSQIGRTANFSQLALLLQFGGDRQEINGGAVFNQVFKRFPNPAVPVDVKVAGIQKFSHIIIGLRVDQNRTQNSLFGFAVLRHDLRAAGSFAFKRGEFAHKTIRQKQPLTSEMISGRRPRDFSSYLVKSVFIFVIFVIEV